MATKQQLKVRKQPKRSKESVDYGKGHKDSHCSICRHYTSGSCELVAGKIDPSYWCKLFKKK